MPDQTFDIQVTDPAKLNMVEGYVELNDVQVGEGVRYEELREGDILGIGRYARATVTVFDHGNSGYFIAASDGGEGTSDGAGGTVIELVNGIVRDENGQISVPRDVYQNAERYDPAAKYFIRRPRSAVGVRG